MKLSEGGEELVGREGQASHSVNLVNEEDDRPLYLFQHDLAHGARPTLKRAESFVVEPEVFKLVFEVELLADASE